MRDSRERDHTPASFRREQAALLSRERRRKGAARIFAPAPRVREWREENDERASPATARLRAEMVRAMPQLRALALSLCSDPDHADDLVQEAVARALSRLALFEEGTNLVGWLFTILRNFYYSDYHKRRRETADPDGRHAATLVDAPTQEHLVELLQVDRVLARLPAEQREALTLVAVGGCTYEEAALICKCPVGTVRSRISRARGELTRVLVEAHDAPSG
ncbi:sigma-70 family RNA polymerase sigma factor [Methylosinus trichosporium]|uniref:RNA polymerase subunit sigma-24 n=1 Tax=Methylosinus trichosporium (strain ATCC 35070 / NCIMB 11131 / UNIQEM 75 / OB3b) TaxID=595536 RepID=A0A2D2D4G4_METT3|nr:sigma-70 family RNA polymerase sigma factor [Methylosinus trichosporium]ATQ69873.1 RNA polymerase subunit sigma-24 [Methylosinus trichosporium OB3b]